MRFIKQLLIILGVTFAGEALHFLLPLPVPASIYGLVLMLLCLCFKVFPLRAVEETGDFLIDLMPALFVPATVGVMAAWDVLQPVLLQVALITFLSLIVVMAVSGRVTQWALRREAKHHQEEKHHA
jgi:holin-like protein